MYIDSLGSRIGAGFNAGLEDIVEVSDSSLQRHTEHQPQQHRHQQNGELCVKQGVITLSQHPPHTGSSNTCFKCTHFNLMVSVMCRNFIFTYFSSFSGENTSMQNQSEPRPSHLHYTQHPPPLPLPTSSPSLKHSPQSPSSPNYKQSPQVSSPTRTPGHLYSHSAPSFSQYINKGVSQRSPQLQDSPPPARPPKSPPAKRGYPGNNPPNRAPPSTPPSSPPTDKQQPISPQSPTHTRHLPPQVNLAKPYSQYNASSSQRSPHSPASIARHTAGNLAGDSKIETVDISGSTSPRVVPSLPKLSPPPGSIPVSRSTNFTVKAEIESPPVASVKSWPGSPVKEKSVHRNTDDIIVTTAEKQGSCDTSSAGNGLTANSSFVGKQGNINNDSSTPARGNNTQQQFTGDNSIVNNNSTSHKNIDKQQLTTNENGATSHSSDINTRTMPAVLDSKHDKGGEGDCKLSRKPSLNKSKSDEALAGVRIRKGDQVVISRIPVTSQDSDSHHQATDDQLNTSFDSAASKKVFSSRAGPSNKPLSRGRSGNESPGSESVASLMSQATVITHTGAAESFFFSNR